MATLTTPPAAVPGDDRSRRESLARTVLRYDVPASLVVFLVALPLSLGIAVASDAPPLAGLIAAIVGGLVAGALGGSPLQVSGPAAGLTVIVAGLIAEFGWKVTCAITVCAGVLQILFGLSKVGRAALAISPMVVHAMLAGIGITIALQQVHVLLGGQSQSSAWHNIVNLPADLAGADGPGLALGLLVIAILVAWRRVPPALRKVPGPLVAIIVASVAALVLAPDVPKIALDGSLLDAVALPSLPDGNWGAFAAGVLTVALIASVESLLTAVAVDRMHTGVRSDLDRELVGQGTANMVSGSIGGLPVTGVIVRSSANVAAGARTRASSVLHGVWVLVFALPFAWLAEKIPTAALAGLLVVIGVQLVKITHIKTARRTGDIAVYLVTLLGVVFLNLLNGVLLGLAVSVLMTLWRLARTRVVAEPDPDGDWRVDLEGSCTFLSLPRLHQALVSVPPGSRVRMRMSVTFTDHAARDFLTEWQRQHEATGGTVVVEQGPGHRTGDHDMLPALRASNKPRNPRTLFITCTDPKIFPNAIMGSDPGDLFIVRNVGNLVPAGQFDLSIEAAIAYAVKELEVSSIVVCGHSDCSAMHAALVCGQRPSADPSLRSWLVHTETTRAAYRDGEHPLARCAARNGLGAADQLSVVNVAVQAKIVAQHPLVRGLLAQGRLSVSGLFYDTAEDRAVTVSETRELGIANNGYGFPMKDVTAAPVLPTLKA
ncbi:MAG: carbonic anhydrase [Mycobacterium sp.]|nr:carbonic anhydrase [Mycobacterium sp.]